MVALHSVPNEPTRRITPPRRTPLLWRTLIQVDRAVVALTGRLVVTGNVPVELRDQPVLMAANHIGNFDVLVLIAACHEVGVAPRFLATGGLFDAPVVGPMLRACGHVRVDRGKGNATAVVGRAVEALSDGSPVLMYPEGRISHDPELWPERGKTGVARMALASGVPVLPVSQWGAHEAMYWGTLTVSGWADIKPLLSSWLRAIRTRPTFRVQFGGQVDLSDLSATKPGNAVRARDRIMRAIAAGLSRLRPEELDKQRFYDPTRPTDSSSPWKPS